MIKMKTNRISELQYAFLREVRDRTVSLEDLTEKYSLLDKQFSRWMRGVGFRRELTKVMNVSKRRRRLVMRMAANVAAERLAAAVRRGEKLDEPLMELYERVLNQGRKEEQTARAEKRSRGGTGGRRRLPSPDEDLCHPDAKEQEHELLAFLEADAAAGEAVAAAVRGKEG